MQDQLDRMCRLTRMHAGNTASIGRLPRIALFVSENRTRATSSLYRPMLCLVLQGAKEVTIGDRRLRYDPGSYFVATLDLPACGQIVEASPEQPYICVTLALDHDVIAELVPDLPARPEGHGAGFATSPVSAPLLDSWARMLALLDAPHDVPVLAPLIEREILYRLLQGPQGGVLRQIACADSRIAQIRAAIAWIRAHYDTPIRIETLADLAGMSTASFHRHFKAATAMSPLQYQKKLRLQEARRLLVAKADATHAAYSVGYESTSQFSREYARMFGAPPSRDAERLRGLEEA
ncbi:AraC family transcriptional regulator N-terminal domain-containing protein [Sphingomonas sp. MMS24-J13]|uniref:AraC family transcriptional regulator n=1 Tax=Sphingomonas sp. MMS24-J13 TaxID=3238686 RepID=UPI00384E34CB